LRELSEAAVPLLAGTVLLLLLPRLAPSWTVTAIALGIIVAGAICILELGLDMPIRNALHLRAKAFEYNRPVLTLLVLFWPLFTVAVTSRRAALCWLAVGVATAAIWSSHSGTAMLAQIASAIAILLAWRWPRPALILAGLAVAATFAIIFAFGDLAWRVLPDSAYQALAWTHAQDRVDIWRSFGAAMLTHPWLGTGFGTSVTLGDTTIASEVAEKLRRMLSVGHPHNGYLQIGVELGLAGCLIALAASLMLLRSWRHLSGPHLFARFGLFTMAAATMLVGHGAWQAWWIAVLFAGAAVTRICDWDTPDRRA
jgi:O-antigen ligase